VRGQHVIVNQMRSPTACQFKNSLLTRNFFPGFIKDQIFPMCYSSAIASILFELLPSPVVSVTSVEEIADFTHIARNYGELGFPAFLQAVAGSPKIFTTKVRKLQILLQ
jgi:hypothetical protein